MSTHGLKSVAVATMLLTLAACGKTATKATSAQSASSAAASSGVPASAAAGSGATIASARTIANRLLAGGLPPPDGYSALAPLACAAPTNGETWALRCRTQFRDSQRRGQPAIVDVQLYDQDAAFDSEDAPLKAHIESLRQSDTLSMDPGVIQTIEKTGQKINLPGACHQARGAHNSPAYCSDMDTPRILIIAGVKPAEAASHGMTVSVENGVETNSAAPDMNHAADLLTQVTGSVNAARFP